MITLRPFVLVLLLAGLMTWPVSPAGASVITQTETFSGTPSLEQTLTFDQWSNDGYNLLSIEITLVLEVSGGYLSVDNDSTTNTAFVTVELGADGTVTSSTVTLLDSSFGGYPTITSTTSDSFTLEVDDGDGGVFSDTGPDAATLIGDTVSLSDSLLINSLFFSGYSGTGTYDLVADITQIVDFTAIGGVQGSFSPVSASGSITVTYIDEAPVGGSPVVPEPTTLLLFGSGALGLIGLKRSKSRRKKRRITKRC